MELGIYTFAEATPDPATGRLVSPAERLRDLMEEIELADQVGLEVFGVGEHHRPDFAVSAPAVVLAAAAQRTKTIRLGRTGAGRHPPSSANRLARPGGSATSCVESEAATRVFGVQQCAPRGRARGWRSGGHGL